MSEVIPEGWINTSIDSSCVIYDSLRVPLNSQERSLRLGPYPYYGANGVQGYIDNFIFDGTYLLLAEDGGYFDEWDSRPISYLVSGKFWVNNHAHILQARPGYDTRFVHYNLVHKNILKFINGGTRSKLNQSDMREISFLAPPLPEQQKIATILSSVDDVIEKTRAQIDKLKDLKTGMMQELLTQGIGHTEFKDSPVGRIPAGWSVIDLGRLLDAIFDCEHKTAPYVEQSPYMVIRTSNVRNGELVFNDMRYTTHDAYDLWTRRAVPQYGDILFTREAPAGESCIVPEGIKICMGQRLVLLRTNKNAVSSDFLSLYLNSQKAKSAIQDLTIGTTVTRINIDDIGKIPCAIPSMTEQIKISLTLRSIIKKLSAETKKLYHLEAIKKALMQDLLTGKVRVKLDSPEVAAA